uniref:Uncharacterized protein n=1 Tax=Oryza glumipatula TaxID=40148 RepID=A0A0D9ZKF8_9ORYZ
MLTGKLPANAVPRSAAEEARGREAPRHGLHRCRSPLLPPPRRQRRRAPRAPRLHVADAHRVGGPTRCGIHLRRWRWRRLRFSREAADERGAEDRRCRYAAVGAHRGAGGVDDRGVRCQHRRRGVHGGGTEEDKRGSEMTQPDMWGPRGSHADLAST